MKKNINRHKNYWYIYKYKKGHEVQRLIKQKETVTQRCNTDRTTFLFLFFFDWGYMCGRQNHKEMTR